MILADVNVLIYAFRTDAQDHGDYKRWLEDVINGPSAYGVAPQVLSGVVRICTHPRIFVRPSKIEEAFAFCRVLLEQPNASLITPGGASLGHFSGLVSSGEGLGQSRSRRLAGGAGARVRLRVDHDGSRLCAFFQAQVAHPVLSATLHFLEASPRFRRGHG